MSMKQALIETIKLPEKYLKTVECAPNTDRQYLGQPDMVILKDHQTLLLAYPKGHGKGPIILQRSEDAGKSWVEQTNLPQSWHHSLETPTMYRLTFVSGKEKLLLIAGRPNWHNNTIGGWDTSYSDDDGRTWSEFETVWSVIEGKQHWTCVAMSSLIQLHDNEGNPIDQWLAVYHDADFYNYQTILSFDKNDQPQWSKPTKYLSHYRKMEKEYQLCEVGLFRSPDNQRIVGLVRSQSHCHPSVLIYSEDGGKTWSEPQPLSLDLLGERHKIVYDPISQRLVITFREIIFDFDESGHLLVENWKAGNWVAWIGSYEALMTGQAGEYRILIAEDWTNSPRSGDTGYTGIATQPDGTILMSSYGHWNREFSSNWTGTVTTDLCYIKFAKFKLSDIRSSI